MLAKEQREQLISDWGDYSYDTKYEKSAEQLPGLDDIDEILFYEYSYRDYSGYAFLLVRMKDGTLAESHGSHCSCNGLEGQWSLDPVTKPELEKRFLNREPEYYSDPEDMEGLRKVITELP